jgi:hypothetical protein
VGCYECRGEPFNLEKGDRMTAWHGIVLGAMAFAGTAITGSTADYIGLLGCFSPPDPSDIEPVSREHSASASSEPCFEADVLTLRA